MVESPQVPPPSVVMKRRPSLAVTVADDASTADMATKSIGAGDVTCRNVTPSVARNTTPARPASQHTSGPGADPAVMALLSSRVAAVQLVPPSVLRSARSPARRQRTDLSGDTTSLNANGRAIDCSNVAATRGSRAAPSVF